jgi:putative transposase
MARPYSTDLRERVVAAVACGGRSCREAAAQFGVGVSTAIRWVARQRRTGSVAAGRMGGRRPKLIVGAHREWLIGRCRGGDFTLRELVAALAERGLKVDYRTVWSFVHAEGLSFKKNRAGWRAGPPRHRPPARAMAAVSASH